ncbi:MAG: tRNA (adenosine(37)-N6)-threonylcarbamoyltransferase complex ATPase subunit type 1 TsaE [Elusimicrobiales bacterium]|nr:tRNA (adenosine(37)-N6)-threonylcarbamoyltransferase complex ATPase subunit type 1 TsaE [Elusimicrobiales bacterium]
MKKKILRHLNTFRSLSKDDTLNFASNFSKTLNKGDLVLLEGEIGVGKTTFVNGIIKGLGSNELVISSSFVLISTYKTSKFNLVHCDFYRVCGIYDFNEIIEYLDGNNVVMIEWPYKIEKYISFSPYVVRIYFNNLNISARKIEVLKYE